MLPMTTCELGSEKTTAVTVAAFSPFLTTLLRFSKTLWDRNPFARGRCTMIWEMCFGAWILLDPWSCSLQGFYTQVCVLVVG